jgi:hypothetical protein
LPVAEIQIVQAGCPLCSAYLVPDMEILHFGVDCQRIVDELLSRVCSVAVGSCVSRRENQEYNWCSDFGCVLPDGRPAGLGGDCEGLICKSLVSCIVSLEGLLSIVVARLFYKEAPRQRFRLESALRERKVTEELVMYILMTCLAVLHSFAFLQLACVAFVI